MISVTTLLTGIPTAIRAELFSTYKEIVSNYVEHRWEPSELNGGKFCEVVFTIVSGALKGAIPPKASKPASMLHDCQALEKLPADANRVGDRSLRVLIPRVLPVLYEVRNNRNVGHVGAEVNPNCLDATAVYSMASWTLAEIIRIFHNVSVDEAQGAVDSLMERKHPLIWEVEGKRRVLDLALNAREQTLLLLHGKPSWVPVSEVVSWTEYSNPSKFRNDVLSKMHSARLIEYDKLGDRICISPMGVTDVETKILKSRTV